MARGAGVPGWLSVLVRAVAAIVLVIGGVQAAASTTGAHAAAASTGVHAAAATTGAGTAAAITGATPAPTAQREVALLAGGCYWGMEEILRKVPGVLETEVGFTGGFTGKPTYEEVSTGRTGHAESVRVVFDPAVLSYEDLLEKWFFRMHDPTTKNQQGHDVGSQYRSAIFVTSEAQRAAAERVVQRVNASGKWKSPVVTTIETAGPFTPAAADHQDYLQKHPSGYTCHYLRD